MNKEVAYFVEGKGDRKTGVINDFSIGITDFSKIELELGKADDPLKQCECGRAV